MRLLFCLCLCLGTVLPASAKEPIPEILSDYMPDRCITKFEGPVSVWMTGGAKLEGQDVVQAVLEEIRRILPGLRITETNSKNKANIRIYLTESEKEWQETVTQKVGGGGHWEEYGPNLRGLTRMSMTGKGEMVSSDVVFRLDFQSSGGQKRWVIRHELMHALGVGGHPKTVKNSVLNSFQRQIDKNGLFSDEDILVLKTLYRPDVRAGDTW